MKIAQIAPIIERVPPKKYGGTERVVYALTEELVRLGHDVTLFASGDSLTSATLAAVTPRALREMRIKELYGLNAKTLQNIGVAYDRAREFDIIHDHSGYYSLAAANLSPVPVVMTYHGPINADAYDIYKALPYPYLVTISNDQGRYVQDLNIIGTVYNGLSMEEYPFSPHPGNYLLFVGRLSMEKGPHYAIETALALNLPLVLAAKLDDIDRPYFKEYIEPYLSEDIRWIGEVDEEERNRLMSRALCFLHPITWREPFGLTLIEAMACGCPVVAFGRGSIPELVEDGKSGFVVSNLEEMIRAVRKIREIDRRACRRHALENFSSERMAKGYEAVYQKILKG